MRADALSHTRARAYHATMPPAPETADARLAVLEDRVEHLRRKAHDQANALQGLVFAVEVVKGLQASVDRSLDASGRVPLVEQALADNVSRLEREIERLEKGLGKVEGDTHANEMGLARILAYIVAALSMAGAITLILRAAGKL